MEEGKLREKRDGKNTGGGGEADRASGQNQLRERGWNKVKLAESGEK